MSRATAIMMAVLALVPLAACGSNDSDRTARTLTPRSAAETGLGPDGCGLEVLDCDPEPSPRLAAECTTLSFVDAAKFEFDNSKFAGDARCDGAYAVITVALGDCLPELPAEQRPDCERYKRAYLTNRDSIWRAVTYGPLDYGCDDLATETGVEFPPEVCAP